MLTMQTVRESIQRYEQIIPAKPKEQMNKLFETLNISLSELAVYQEKKSIAFSMGKIDQELAQYIYERLLNWGKTSLAERVTLTQVFMRLMRH